MLRKIETEAVRNFGSFARFEKETGSRPRELKSKLIRLVSKIESYNNILHIIGFEFKLTKLHAVKERRKKLNVRYDGYKHIKHV